MSSEWLPIQPSEATANPQVWSAADGAVSLFAQSNVIEEIRAEVFRAAFGSSRAAVEVAGLLIGSRTPLGLEITGWLPIRCSWSLGPRFALTSREQATLTCMLDGLHLEVGPAGREPLGWFVSRINGDSAPSAFELELQNKSFHGHGNLFLVFQPKRDGTVRGAIYVFAGEHGLQVHAPLWQIEPALVPAAREPATNGLVAEDPRFARRNRGRTPATENSTEGVASGESAEPTAPLPPMRHGGFWDGVPHGVWHLLAGALLIVIALGGWLWLFRPETVRAHLPVWLSLPAAAPVENRLLLQAKSEPGRVAVRWNGTSEVLKNAARTQLVFEFDKEPAFVTLRAEQARRGAFETPVSESPRRVTMIVESPSGARMRESVEFAPTVPVPADLPIKKPQQSKRRRRNSRRSDPRAF